MQPRSEHYAEQVECSRKDAILVAMERWSAAHRAFVIEAYFKSGDSVVATQRRFRQRFNTGRRGRVPERHTIRRWVDQFRATASAVNKTPPGRPRTVRTPENIERVRSAIDRSPRRSATRHAALLHVSDRSVRRILHSDLSYHPYKLQVTHKLSERDYASRKQFSTDFIALLDENPDILPNLIMSDEAHFELTGHVNKQNMRYWSNVNPQVIHEKPLHSAKVTVWCGISASRIIGPYFFEDQRGNAVTVNSDRYTDLLTTFLMPELQRRGVDLTSVYFQQDGATAHTARNTMATLRTVFAGRIISRFGDISWPARSPDLSACDFFLWGYLKSRVFASRVPNVEILKQRIREEVQAVPVGMLQTVMDSFARRLRQCIAKDGGYLTDVIFKK